MAYAAVISLKHTIERLQKPCHIPLNHQNSSPENIKILYKEILSLHNVLKELDSCNTDSSNNIDRDSINALDAKIRESTSQFEDLLEESLVHPLELNQHIDSFTREVNRLNFEYFDVLSYSLPEVEAAAEEEDDDDDCFRFCGNTSPNTVGLSDQFMKIRNAQTRDYEPSGLKVFSLVGMAGIGKTTLAKKLFHDPLISSHFERRAFVTLGPKYQLENVLLHILKQVFRHDDMGDETMLLIMNGGEDTIDGLRRVLCVILMDRRYLIVLDDVWSLEAKHQFVSLFPVNDRGSQVLMTTRLQHVAKTADFFCKYDVRFLDKKESWDLLREKVFAEEDKEEGPSYPPPELEEAGKKIAENCDGLPLTIVTIAGIISRSHEKKSREYWNKVAADKQNPTFVDAYDQMHEVLYPSYDYLPQHLKPFFLYMGVFPQNYEIPYSKLVKLWAVEGLIPESDDGLETPEHVAWSCFGELLERNVVLIHKKSLTNLVKTCGLHFPIWHLCNKEARRNKFFHALNNLDDGLAEEELRSQRRLCVRDNALFGIKRVCDSMASVSTVRSLLCTGPHHDEYPLPICWGLRLLRILDALSILFDEFPLQVLEQVHLRYLSLTLINGDIPASISKLLNLQHFIVRRHLSNVKFDGINNSYLPMAIWDMKELEHLQVMGSDLPDPREDSLLPNLLTLLDVSPRSCTKDVLRRIPNLQNLGIRVELASKDHNADEPLCFFDHISDLCELEKLKCIVVNPRNMSDKVVAPPAPAPPRLSIFSESLVKLTLAGFGYPWDEMSKISELPRLRVLKLRRNAFRGPKWEAGNHIFPRLQYLMIEDTDLVEWTCGRRFSIPFLESLRIQRCHKLAEIPLPLSTYMRKIELVDCNSLDFNGRKPVDEIAKYRNRGIDLAVHSPMG